MREVGEVRGVEYSEGSGRTNDSDENEFIRGKDNSEGIGKVFTDSLSLSIYPIAMGKF